MDSQPRIEMRTVASSPGDVPLNGGKWVPVLPRRADWCDETLQSFARADDSHGAYDLRSETSAAIGWRYLGGEGAQRVARGSG